MDLDKYKKRRAYRRYVDLTEEADLNLGMNLVNHEHLN